jgi:hypothetical protein
VSIDHAHLTAEHIDQLRQVLDAGVSKDVTHLRDLTSPGRGGVLRVVYRCPKLQHPETPATASDASLSVQNGTRGSPP